MPCFHDEQEDDFEGCGYDDSDEDSYGRGQPGSEMDSGSDAFTDVEDEAGTPKLRVEGYGDVTLPLVDDSQAEALIKVCEQAPFGRGHETLTDTSIRNSWQLEPSKVEILNPEWSAGLQHAQKIVSERFGVPEVPVTLELYRFLLYKAGGHFAKHRDTEKTDRMFATMVVQLLSRHQGGRLMMYKDSEEGVMVHNFGSAAGTAPDNTRAIMAQHWIALAKAGRKFHYFLSHAYTPKSVTELGSAALKGNDRARMANLQSVNGTVDHDHRYALYLAEAERSAAWYGFGPSWDDCDCELSESSKCIVELLGLDGKSMNNAGSAMELYDRDTLNSDRLTELELWKGRRTTTYEGYLGNEGPTKDTTYHKYIILALPLRKLETNLATYVGDEAAFYALKESGTAPDATRMRSFLQYLIKKASDTSANKHPNVYSIEYGYMSARAVDNDQFRHSVFEEILKLPGGTERGVLAELYVLAFPACAQLASTNKPESKWADMLELVNNDDLWQAVQPTVVKKLQGDLTHLHRFLLQCFSSGIPLTKWQDVLAIATSPRTLLPSDVELASLTTQRIRGSRLFSLTLLSFVESSIRTQKAIAKAEAAGLWVFPDAVFAPRPAVQQFFRGTERKMVLGGLDGIGHARNFCNKYQNAGQNTLYTLKPGGIGKNAFVEITKTQGQLNKRKKMSKSLKEEVPLLRAIIVEGSEDTPANSAPTSTLTSQTKASPAESSRSGRRKSGAHEADDDNDDDDVVFIASKRARVN
ncbi:hypothetical protein IAT40_004322 [Kwoniella sp. CBS 6097]